ncbi:conserved hypothetical protein [Thiomonas sp. X19]|uniref:hypothetical protein n=1 Tax=Thiomonas sp. X19 TaxID=1050370 RepID=UPI000B6482B8|nr:hypothetical protein [Thiomonas sp. X19]SCC91909.1 conserved hypothetical protein [Thiomonas sp. X19]
MDILTFVAKLIEFTAWPIATVALVAMLRSEIRSLLPHVKKLKAGPLEAEFEREVKELEAMAKAQPQLIPSPEGLTPERHMLLQLVEVNPRSAVLEAWRGIEESAIRVVRNKALYVPEREAHSPFAVIRALNKENILSAEEVSLYHDLRTLRNQAAHVEDFSPTADAALSYIELASGLRRALEAAAE